MHKPSNDTPSSIVFSAAKRVAEDMREGVDAVCDDLVDFVRMFDNMAEALKETKRNLERHAIPISPRRSKQRREIRRKIAAITEAIEKAQRLRKTLELTLDDINETVKPSGLDVGTRDFLNKIMEPSDDELRRIEDEDFDQGGDPDMPPPDAV